MDKEAYTTIPLGIILTQDAIITVCTEDTPVLQSLSWGELRSLVPRKDFVLYIRYCSGLPRYIRVHCGSLTKREQRLRNELMEIPRISI